MTDIETELLQSLALNGEAILTADSVSESISARCHEEARVWSKTSAAAIILPPKKMQMAHFFICGQ